MARDPGSQWMPLVEWNDQGSFIKDKFIVHSTGDRATAAQIYAYFNRPEVVVESTFIVGLTPADPTLQILDSSAMADANLSANRSGISVEVVGAADDEYTDWQKSELIRLGRWAHAAHGIPHQVVPAAIGAGYGWHVMFGAPGPWTPVAKVCPGDKRIAVLKKEIFPAIFGPTPVPYVPAPASTAPALGYWTLPPHHYYGLATGPYESHGGFYASERPAIKRIQQRLIAKGYVPGLKDWRSGWADGIYEQATADAVTRFQKKEMPGTTRFGQVWSDDWARLAR